MCSRREWFSDLKPFSRMVAYASKDDNVTITEKSTVFGTLKGREIILKDILFVPNLNGELISAKNIKIAGCSVIFKDSKAVVRKGQDCL